MKKLLFAVFGALISLTALGQDLLQCINPEITQALIMTARDAPEYVVTGDTPDEIEGLETPSGFEWIGSRSADFDTRAAYKTNLNAEDARTAFLEAMQRAGFMLRREDTSGFQLTSPPLQRSFCRDQVSGSLMVRDINDMRYVTLSLRSDVTTQPCPERLSPTSMMGISRGFELIPRLDPPASVRMSSRPGAMPTGTGSGGGDTYTSVLEVEGVDSMPGLVEALAEQIRAQGWAPEATWSGSLSAGSAWTRVMDDGSRLAGTLTVQSIGAGYHNLSFMLLTM